MKFISLSFGLLMMTGSLWAQSVLDVAQTHRNTLNDLIRKVPVISTTYDKPLRRLSAVQEQLYLYELKMRGEGLPFEMMVGFSANYSAILNALVEDRITEQCGRELLETHRRLLGEAQHWLDQRVQDEEFPKRLAEHMANLQAELERQAVPLRKVSDDIRTPIINGYQAWLGELIAWGEDTGKLSSGDLARLRTKGDELERFERYYKADGMLQPFERELLHGRFLHLTLETIAVISR